MLKLQLTAKDPKHTADIQKKVRKHGTSFKKYKLPY